MSNDLKVAITAKVNESNNIRASTKVNISTSLKANVTPIIGGMGGTMDHSKLENLDYESSGHTGFVSEKELENYAKISEMPEALSISELENILK